MTIFTTIPDADINPDMPLKSSTAYALRNNPLAIAEGDASAPSINPAALFIGGKGGDGIWNDAASFTTSGFYEFSSMARTTAMNLPSCTMIRIAGNATLSAALTVLPVWSDNRRRFEASMRATSAGDGGTSGGGGTHGDGNGGSSGLKVGLTYRWWNCLPLLLGGGSFSGGGSAAPGGGATIILVEGNFNRTGGTITADGGTGTAAEGGGGMVLVICTGTITGGTFRARGSGGAGGGGIAATIAAGYAGTQAYNVSGWEAGYSEKTTLTRDQIRTMLQRL